LEDGHSSVRILTSNPARAKDEVQEVLPKMLSVRAEAVEMRKVGMTESLGYVFMAFGKY